MKIVYEFFNIAAPIQLKLRNKYEILTDLAILIFHKKGRLIKPLKFSFFDAGIGFHGYHLSISDLVIFFSF
jgi:hypothetical protein